MHIALLHKKRLSYCTLSKTKKVNPTTKKSLIRYKSKSVLYLNVLGVENKYNINPVLVT